MPWYWNYIEEINCTKFAIDMSVRLTKLSIRRVLSAAVHVTRRRGTSTLILWIENFELDACNYMQCNHWHNHELY